MEGVHTALENQGFVPAEDESRAAEISMYFSADPRSLRVPAGARVIAEHNRIQALDGAGALYLRCEGHACRLDLAGGVVKAVIPCPPFRLRKDFIIYALLLMLRRHGLFALHASGIARAGAGCLFVGPSGSGKSTQTYTLVRQGWEYLGDDAVLLRSGGDAVDALPLRRDLCLDPALAEAFPEISVGAMNDAWGGRGKHRLPMGALYPGRLIDACVPELLVFPEIVSAPESCLVPMPAAEALVRLMKESVVLTLDQGAISCHLHVLSSLIRQAQCWRLLCGRDLRARPERVAVLMEAGRMRSPRERGAR